MNKHYWKGLVFFCDDDDNDDDFNVIFVEIICEREKKTFSSFKKINYLFLKFSLQIYSKMLFIRKKIAILFYFLEKEETKQKILVRNDLLLLLILISFFFGC